MQTNWWNDIKCTILQMSVSDVDMQCNLKCDEMCKTNDKTYVVWCMCKLIINHRYCRICAETD